MVALHPTPPGPTHLSDVWCLRRLNWNVTLPLGHSTTAVNAEPASSTAAVEKVIA